MVTPGPTPKKQYKYKKFCKLPRCGNKFETNRDWQDFCEPDHQREFQKTRRRSDAELRKELRDIKKDQKKMKEKLGIK